MNGPKDSWSGKSEEEMTDAEYAAYQEHLEDREQIHEDIFEGGDPREEVAL